MRRGLIDSLKFAVAERDYRYDRIKKGEREKKTRDLEYGNVKGEKKNQREKTMRAAIDGSASSIHIDVSACASVCVFCLCAGCVSIHTQVRRLCLISMLSGNHQVILRGPFLRCVAQEHIML